METENGPTRRTLLRSAAAVGTLGLAGCDATDDICGADRDVDFESTVTDATGRSLEDRPSGPGWPLRHHDGGNRRVTDASGPRTDVGRFWRFEAFGGGDIAVEDGRMYLVSDRGSVLVLDPATSDILLEYDGLTGPRTVGVVGPPDDRTVVVTARNGLYGFTPDMDRRRFSVSGGDFWTIVGDEDAVYSTGSRTIQAIDLATGTRRWQVSGTIHNAGPIAGGMVVSGTDEGLRGYDTETGEVQWERRNIHPYDSIAAADDLLYIGGLGSVQALNLADGATEWKFEGEAESFEVPAITDDTIVAASSTTEGGGGNVYAIDRETKEHRWCAALGYRDLSSAAVADGVAFIIGNELVQARDISDGSILWTYLDDRETYGLPFVAGDVLYVTDPDEYGGWINAFGEL